ncbi:MAG: beta-phosphoglucomutase family hydrolase [Candidatus Goldbacteria bacterium]|nr:beta-phosphoglucomutase family hydrolase [Candidatus Goldiibacteriota bacterium]
MPFKGAIFDVDGVLIDTAYVHFLSWKEAFKKYNIDFTFKDFKSKIDGLPREKGIIKILPDITRQELHEVAEQKQKYFIKFLKKNKIKKIKGAKKFLISLKRENIKIAVASSSKNAKRNLIRTGLYCLFDADADGSEIKRGKPHPDIFLKAAKMLKLHPSVCVVFEDAQAGVDAAKEAGMKCVGIIRDKNKLKGADVLIKDFSEINVQKIKSIFERK